MIPLLLLKIIPTLNYRIKAVMDKDKQPPPEDIIEDSPSTAGELQDAHYNELALKKEQLYFLFLIYFIVLKMSSIKIQTTNTLCCLNFAMFDICKKLCLE